MIDNKKYICVYCGYRGLLQTFLVKLKSGLYSRKYYKCPDCENQMFRGTLITKITNRYWGAWISVNVRMYGRKFSEKVKWVKLKQRVWDYQISREFWEGYNFIKNNYGRLTQKQLNQLSVLVPIPETQQQKLEVVDA